MIAQLVVNAPGEVISGFLMNWEVISSGYCRGLSWTVLWNVLIDDLDNEIERIYAKYEDDAKWGVGCKSFGGQGQNSKMILSNWTKLSEINKVKFKNVSAKCYI